MRQSLRKFLESICEDVAHGARAGTVASVGFAKDVEELTITADIGGVPLTLEGAAHLPPRIFLAKKANISTSGFLELDEDGTPIITMKRGLMKRAPVVNIYMEFERSQPLESLEMARDRANEVNKMHRAMHAQAFIDGIPLLTEEVSETDTETPPSESDDPSEDKNPTKTDTEPTT